MKGYAFSVHDEEGVRLRRTDNKRAVMDELGEADMEAIVLHKDGKRAGKVEFVWGNGEDVIHDYSVTPDIEAIVNAAMRHSEALGHVRRNPKKAQLLNGYLDDRRDGTMLTDFQGAPLGWRVDATVSNWRMADGSRIFALRLTNGTGKSRRLAGGLWLGDDGTLFRGEILGRAPVHWDAPKWSEVNENILSIAEHWMTKDAEDAEKDARDDDGDGWEDDDDEGDDE